MRFNFHRTRNLLALRVGPFHYVRFSDYGRVFTHGFFLGQRFYSLCPSFPRLARAYGRAREYFPMFWYANQWCCDTRRTFAWYKTWTWGPASVRRAYDDAQASTDGPGDLNQISFIKWLRIPSGGRYE